MRNVLLWLFIQGNAGLANIGTLQANNYLGNRSS